MRGANRLLFILGAVVALFVSGSPYYLTLFPVRVFTHVFFTAALGVWLIGRLRRGGLPRTLFDLPFILLFVWWAFTLTVGLDPRISVETLWFPLVHVIFFYVFISLLQTRQGARLLWETQFLMAALVFMLAGMQLASWLFGLNLVPGTSVGWLEVADQIGFQLPNLYLPLGVTTWLAAYTAPLALVSAAWAMTTPRRDYRVVLWGLSAALVAVLLLANSRGGLLAFGISAVLFALLRLAPTFRKQVKGEGEPNTGRNSTQNPTRRLLAYGLPLLLLVGAIAGAIFFLSRTGARVAGDSLRASLWNAAAELISSDPLTGVGAGQFGRGYRLARPPGFYDDRLGTSHNVVLNTAAELGIPGVLLILLFVAVFAGVWWRNWRRAEGGRRFRLAAAFAALVGFGAQNLVDQFTATPLVLLMLLLVAYCMMDAPANSLTRPRVQTSVLQRAGAAALLILLVGYAGAFVFWDQAQAAFNRSLAGGAGALDEIDRAIMFDPTLNLYHLQRVYLLGQDDTLPIVDRVAAYREAVQREPTWDTGWLNLAAVHLQSGDLTSASGGFATARDLNYANVGAFNWARTAELAEVADGDEIARNYRIALANTLPFAPFWWETDTRRRVAEDVIAANDIDGQYRALIDNDPARAVALVSPNPQTAGEWWVVGEDAYRAEDFARAAHAFAQAARLRRSVDTYASFARALATTDAARAQHYLNAAVFLSASDPYHYENLTSITAMLAPDDETRVALLSRSVGTRVISQNFEGVLFLGRGASFLPAPELQLDNVNRVQLAPVYELAALYESGGDIAGAIAAYDYILARLPDDEQAQAERARLQAEMQSGVGGAS